MPGTNHTQYSCVFIVSQDDFKQVTYLNPLMTDERTMNVQQIHYYLSGNDADHCLHYPFLRAHKSIQLLPVSAQFFFYPGPGAEMHLRTPSSPSGKCPSEMVFFFKKNHFIFGILFLEVYRNKCQVLQRSPTRRVEAMRTGGRPGSEEKCCFTHIPGIGIVWDSGMGHGSRLVNTSPLKNLTLMPYLILDLFPGVFHQKRVEEFSYLI